MATTNQQLAKAAEGWDPVGNMIFESKGKNFDRAAESAAGVSATTDPLGHLGAQLVGQAGEQAAQDLSWIPETINKVGLAGDEGIRQLGLNPDSVKLAIVGYFAPYAVPLVSAALVKARGGSWEDAVLSAAASYAASYVGSVAGEWASSNVGSAVGGGTATTTAGVIDQAASQGLQLTTKEAARIAASNVASMGLQGTAGAAAGNLAGALARAGVGSSVGQLIQNGRIDLDKVTSTMATAGVASGINTLAPQIPGWNNLDKPAQNAIKTAAVGYMSGKNLDALGTSLVSGFIMDEVGKYSSGIKDLASTGYDALAKQLSEMGNGAAEFLSPLKDLFSSSQSAYDSYGSKSGELNDLITQYNANPTPELLQQITEGQKELVSLSKQYTDLSTQYNDRVNEYETTYANPIRAVEEKLLAERQNLIKSSVMEANPNFDSKAYLAQLSPELKAQYQNLSPEEIYLSEYQKNPNQITTWEQLIQSSSPDKVKSVGDQYKAATGFDLIPGSNRVDPYAFSAFQEKVEGTVPWYAAEAQKALDAGDFTGYTQKMTELNKLYSGSQGTQLGSNDSISSQKFLRAMVSGAKAQPQSGTISTLPNQQASQAPQAFPNAQVTNYGFGSLNSLLGDKLTGTEMSNSYLRPTYSYNPYEVEDRLKNISVMDLSKFGGQPDVLSGLQGASTTGNNAFLDQGALQRLSTLFGQVGNDSYAQSLTGLSALDYLKSNPDGGLGSYQSVHSNPYANQLSQAQVPATSGGLGQVANNWAASSGVTNPAARSALAKDLIS